MLLNCSCGAQRRAVQQPDSSLSAITQQNARACTRVTTRPQHIYNIYTIRSMSRAVLTTSSESRSRFNAQHAVIDRHQNPKSLYSDPSAGILLAGKTWYVADGVYRWCLLMVASTM